MDGGVTATIHAAPVVLTMTGPPIAEGAVLVEGDRIAAIGALADLTRKAPEVRVRDWPGILMPGLVNAHAHLEYGPSFTDLAEGGLPFADWIGGLMGRRQGMSERDWQVEAREVREEAAGRGDVGTAIGALKDRLRPGPLTLRQVIEDIAQLVDLAALDERDVAEEIAHRFP